MLVLVLKLVLVLRLVLRLVLLVLLLVLLVLMHIAVHHLWRGGARCTRHGTQGTARIRMIRHCRRRTRTVLVHWLWTHGGDNTVCGRHAVLRWVLRKHVLLELLGLLDREALLLMVLMMLLLVMLLLLLLLLVMLLGTRTGGRR